MKSHPISASARQGSVPARQHQRVPARQSQAVSVTSSDGGSKDMIPHSPVMATVQASAETQLAAKTPKTSVAVQQDQIIDQLITANDADDLAEICKQLLRLARLTKTELTQSPHYPLSDRKAHIPYLKTMIILRAILKMAQSQLPDSKETRELISTVHTELMANEASYIKRVNPKYTAKLSLTADIGAYQDQLAKIRKAANEMAITVCVEDVAKIEQCHKMIANRMRGLLSQIAADAEELTTQLLGPVPCEYLVVGLGSLSRADMTPYSDLEFGILLADASKSGYFRVLSAVMMMRVIQLGETTVPWDWVSNCDLDSRIGPGLMPDLGGRTPMGRWEKDCDFDLIHTPETMAAYLGVLREDTNKIQRPSTDHLLHIELLHLTAIRGNEILLDQYHGYLTKRLDDTSVSETSLRTELVKEMLTKDLKKFDPTLGKIEKEGCFYNPKQDLFRLPQVMMDAIALFYTLDSVDNWGRIKELRQRDLISEAGSDQLQALYSLTTAIRLTVYLHQACQRDFMGITEPDQSNERIARSFQLDDLSAVFEIYYRLIPFYQASKTFLERLEGNGDQDTAWDRSFYQAGDQYLTGQIHMRLLQFQAAKRAYEAALETTTIEQAKAMSLEQGIDPGLLRKDYLIKNELALVDLRLGDYEDAKQYFEYCLGVQLKVFGEGHIDVATSYNNLGLVLADLGDYEGAKGYYLKSIEIKKKVYGTEAHVDVAGSYNNLGSVLQQSLKHN